MADKERFDFLIYNSVEEDVSVNAVIHDETNWLTQKAMAELFDVGVPAINEHLKNIFEEGELDENMVVSKMEITTPPLLAFLNSNGNVLFSVRLKDSPLPRLRGNTKAASQSRSQRTGIMSSDSTELRN